MTRTPDRYPLDCFTHRFQPPCRCSFAPVRLSYPDLPANHSNTPQRTATSPSSRSSSVSPSLPNHGQHSTGTPTLAIQSP